MFTPSPSTGTIIVRCIICICSIIYKISSVSAIVFTSKRTDKGARFLLPVSDVHRVKQTNVLIENCAPLGGQACTLVPRHIPTCMTGLTKCRQSELLVRYENNNSTANRPVEYNKIVSTLYKKNLINDKFCSIVVKCTLSWWFS